jgi:hypothetical protein
MRKLSKITSGIAGVYSAAAELSKQGYIASITLRNAKGIDIMVANENATKTIGVQVKTNQGSLDWWLLSDKAEDYFADNLFYVFVNLNNGRSPDFFIVPSEIVARAVKESHSKWLASPGRKGQKHKDNPMREFKDKEKHYLRRWDLLGLD